MIDDTILFLFLIAAFICVLIIADIAVSGVDKDYE